MPAATSKTAKATPYGLANSQIATLERIARRALVYCTHMIWEANHRSDAEPGDPKVGGHPAACSSSLHLAAGLHLVARHPSDFYCAKPHLAPMDHALHYLARFFRNADGSWMDDATAEGVMHRLRKFSQEGEPVFQSYHAASDPDSWRILPSGTVGIPPVASAYLALAYRYAADHGFGFSKMQKHFWSLMGDSEFREGSLMEALPDIAERELGNVTWIVDYNRQNLDGTRLPNKRGLRGTDADRIERTCRANGWEVIQLRHGRKRDKLFRRQGGAALRAVLQEGFSDYEFQSHLWKRDPEALRALLLDRESKLGALLNSVSDEDLLEAYTDLGGHDMVKVLRAYEEARRNLEVPVIIVAHTVKGWGLDCYAEPGNHSTIPSEEEVHELLSREGLTPEKPYEIVAGDWQADGPEEDFLQERSRTLRRGVEESLQRKADNLAKVRERLAPTLPLPTDFGINLSMVPMAHTQWLWGQVAGRLVRVGTYDELERAGIDPGRALTPEEQQWSQAADLVMTMSPDVGTSTNINPAMDAKIYGPETGENLEESLGLKERGRPELFTRADAWTRHIRFEIAEANCMSAAGSFGIMGEFSGVPFLPMMTVYDFFIKRALDQLYYNVYWRSSFVLVGTPSGVTLSPEGAQHSWKSDIQMPSLITWEPFFAKEMEWILADAIRRHIDRDNEDRNGVVVRGVTRGVQQKELLKRLKAQPRFADAGEEEIWEATRLDTLAGGYKLIDRSGEEGYAPGENVVHILCMGSLGTEAVAASDRLLEVGVCADVIVVTSADLLLGRFAQRDGHAQLRKLGLDGALHLAPGEELPDAAGARLLAARAVPIVSVADGEIGLLDNAGSILGVPQIALGVEKFSKSGRPADIFGYQGLDAAGIFDACGRALAESTLREVRLSPSAMQELAGGGPAPDRRDWRQLWPYSFDGSGS